MKKVFLIHGFTSSPNAGWLPWLMSELKDRGIYAASLVMPNPDEPKPEEWVSEIDRQISLCPNDDVYLVGHSLGSAAILNYLQGANGRKVKGVVLVSGRCQKSSNPLTESFYKDFDFLKIKSKSDRFVVIHGDADTFVSVENAYILSEKLGIDPIIVPGAGHFTTGEGWKQHPLCLKKLEEIL